MPVLKPIKLILVCAGIAGLWQGAGVVKADSGDLLANLSPVSDTMLAAPSASDWLMWRRTYDGFGFSPLDQITKANVADLELAGDQRKRGRCAFHSACWTSALFR